MLGDLGCRICSVLRVLVLMENKQMLHGYGKVLERVARGPVTKLDL